MRMPVLDKNFYPMIKALKDFENTVKNSEPIFIGKQNNKTDHRSDGR